MDFQLSMQNPGKVFADPEAVESSTQFDTAQKRAILTQWKNQLEQLQKASWESMLGPESNGAGAECLRRVVDALTRLDR